MLKNISVFCELVNQLKEFSFVGNLLMGIHFFVGILWNLRYIRLKSYSAEIYQLVLMQ